MRDAPYKPQHQDQIKQHNLNLILSLIRAKKGISRIELARSTGLSPTSMTRIVGKLERAGLVRSESGGKTGKAGRNAMRVALNSKAFYTLAIALFKDLICVGLMDFAGDIVAQKQARPSVRVPAAKQIFSQAKSVFDALLAECGVQRPQVKSVGICCTGAVDREAKTIIFSTDFMWTNIDVGGICGALFDLPLVVENDVKAALIAERNAFYINESNIAYLSLDIELQAAVVCGGQLLGGNINAFGAVGHVVVNPYGRQCECGRRGCLNTLVNERFLVDKARIYAGDINTADEVMMAYQLRLDWAVSIVEAFAKNICMAINLVVCAYNPAVVITGGRFFRRYPFLLNLVQKYCQELFYKPLSKDITVVMAAGAHTEGLSGVGALAQDVFLSELLEDVRNCQEIKCAD